MPEGQGHGELSRDLGLFTITMVGVGAMIGAGIFVLTGIAAGAAGPALIVAFAANGVVTLLTALAYAELGSAIPEAGGGYLWVKQGLPGPNAFLAGWMSWFAHAVAGSLYALGFGSYLGLVLDEFGWTILGMGGHALEKPFAVLIALAFIGINFRGVSETGLAGNIVTVAKVVIIGIFIASGLWRVFHHTAAAATHFTPFAPEGLTGVLTAMGLTYIAFEGYEIIVQAGEEVKDPKRNIPRAVLWSLAIVIPIYILVAVAALGAVEPPTGEPSWMWLGAHKELGLAEAARQFMPLGSTLLLVGGILSTMSALNATTFSSTRVSFAMGRDRNLPDFFSRIHGTTRTPWLALLASGGLIVFMALAIPIEDVAAAADVMFLLLFLQVNVAIITIRRKYGDKLDYGFLIPFFPVLPIVAIALMLVIAVFMFRFSPVAWFFVVGWIGTGFAIYYLYARDREREGKLTPVAMRAGLEAEYDYHVVVPVANPKTAPALIELGAMMARARDGQLVLLHVVSLPEQTPLRAGRQFVQQAYDEVLDDALAHAESLGVHATAAIRMAHRPALAILDEIEAARADLVILGWRGRRGSREFMLGSNIDIVLRDAPCEVMLLRAEDLDVGSIMVPVSNPAQAPALVEAGAVVAAERGATLDLLHLIEPSVSADEGERRLRDLEAALRDGGYGEAGNGEAGDGEAGDGEVGDGEEQRGRGVRGGMRLETSSDPVATIMERSAEYDLTVVGAGSEGWIRKLIAGRKAERIGRDAANRTLLVRKRRGAVKSRFLDTVEFFRAEEPPEIAATGGGDGTG